MDVDKEMLREFILAEQNNSTIEPIELTPCEQDVELTPCKQDVDLKIAASENIKLSDDTSSLKILDVFTIKELEGMSFSDLHMFIVQKQDALSSWKLDDLIYSKSFEFLDSKEYLMFICYLEELSNISYVYISAKRMLEVSVHNDAIKTCSYLDNLYCCKEESNVLNKDISNEDTTKVEKFSQEIEISSNILNKDSDDISNEDTSKVEKFSQEIEPEISSNINTILVSNDKKHIRLGIARIGSWKHPLYKHVTFTQKDFDDIITNFNSNELGFEPPLFLGHTKDGMVKSGNNQYETVAGEPAEGFLSSIEQEGDALYSTWEIVNSSCYDAVSNGRYRYNSGEFLRNYISKRSGKSVGTVLMAMALTNKPFVPNLPRVLALSENQTDADLFTFTQYQEEIMSDSQEQKLTEDNKSLQLKLSETETRLVAVEDSYKEQLTEQQTLIVALSEKLRHIELEKKVARIEKLALPREVKDKHIQMLSNNSNLGETIEEDILSSLEMVANAKAQLFTQQGLTSDTTRVTDANPYAAIIERNKVIK